MQQDRDHEVLLDAHEFWNTETSKRAKFSHHLHTRHWSKAKWLAVGQKHLDMFRRGMSVHENGGPLKSLLEWGPGGGTNVVAFSEVFDRIVGVDVSIDSLRLCGEAAGEILGKRDLFDPFPIAIDNPFAARELKSEGDPFDFLLCTAVIQHMPFMQYVYDVMCLWRELLRPGARALIQFRTNFHSRDVHRSLATRYSQNVSRWLMFEVPVFEQMVERSGWELLELINGGRPTDSGYVFAWLGNP